MKKRFIAITVLAALFLSACASAPQQKAPTEIDTDYVTSVERHARSAGVEVQWVNPPRRERMTEEQG